MRNYKEVFDQWHKRLLNGTLTEDDVHFDQDDMEVINDIHDKDDILDMWAELYSEKHRCEIHLDDGSIYKNGFNVTM